MKYFVRLANRELGFDVRNADGGTTVEISRDDVKAHSERVDLAPVHVSSNTGEGLYSLLVDGKSYQLYIELSQPGLRVALGRHRFDIQVLTEREWRLQKVAPRQSAHSGPLVVAAPMPGLVKAVHVAVGDRVSAGQRLLVLEAMKMENDITAPREGTVATVSVQPGSVVDGGKSMISIDS